MLLFDSGHGRPEQVGLVLSSTPSPRMAPRDAFKDLLPIVPTARRTFARTDRVTAFARPYQRGVKTPVAATARVGSGLL